MMWLLLVPAVATVSIFFFSPSTSSHLGELSRRSLFRGGDITNMDYTTTLNPTTFVLNIYGKEGQQYSLYQVWDASSTHSQSHLSLSLDLSQKLPKVQCLLSKQGR